MTLNEVMSELMRFGTAQNVKIYKRHGAKDPMFGVSFANLKALKRRIRTDQRLAEELWATGNLDAQTLAAMTADPDKCSESLLDDWIREVKYHGLTDILVRELIIRHPSRVKLAERWLHDEDEWVGRAGWTLVSLLATGAKELPDAWFTAPLTTIQTGIHTKPNRTREAMNSALIGIGIGRELLRERALAIAASIGQVHVDQGETGCKTPDAAGYILKSVHRKQSGKVE